MVLRGGVGLFVAPFQVTGVPGLSNPINQFGYSRNTLMPVTDDNGLTFQANLTNPMPSGELLQPVGSSLGLSANLGGSPGTMLPRRAQQPAVLALQHRRRAPVAVATSLVEVSYLGQKGQNLPIVEPINYVPEAFRTQSAIRDTAAETFLTARSPIPSRDSSRTTRAPTARPSRAGGCCCSTRSSTRSTSRRYAASNTL